MLRKREKTDPLTEQSNRKGIWGMIGYNIAGWYLYTYR